MANVCSAYPQRAKVKHVIILILGSTQMFIFIIVRDLSWKIISELFSYRRPTMKKKKKKHLKYVHKTRSEWFG